MTEVSQTVNKYNVFVKGKKVQLNNLL